MLYWKYKAVLVINSQASRVIAAWQSQRGGIRGITLYNESFFRGTLKVTSMRLFTGLHEPMDI